MTAVVRVPLARVEMLPFRVLLERVAEGETLHVVHGQQVVAVVGPADLHKAPPRIQ